MIANPDSMEDCEAKFSAKTDNDPSARSITPLLCFDIHERASTLYERADSAAIQAVLHDDFRFMQDGSSIGGTLMPAENYLLFYNRSCPNEFGDSKATSNLKQFVKGIVIQDLPDGLGK